ncbi:MAG: class I SAM-dependent methyltransferase, partial [Planctomycetaceae bacterium]
TPGRLIDLGCGTGRSLLEFASRGFECTGVDLSQPSLTRAHSQTQPALLAPVLLRANLCELDCLPAESFDYGLLLFGTLGMVCGTEARTRLLNHAARLLRPSGQLALHVHNLWPHLFLPGGRTWLIADLWRRLRGSADAGDTWRAYRGIPRIHHHVFTRREIVRLLERCGFQLIEIIPLSAHQSHRAAGDLTARGFWADLRCTGWMIRAKKAPPVDRGSTGEY